MLRICLLLLAACGPATIEVKGGDDTGEISCATGAGDDCDGDGYAAADGDCDDYASSVHPDAVEDCADGTDSDCDGFDDGVDPDCNAVDLGDDDGDGYSEDDGDCDDADASVNPGAAESWYDGVDQDCDGASDYDMDGDGHDASDYGGGDCDDGDATVSPDATEACNGIDDDCDGSTDETGSVGGDTWYADADSDGYGDAGSSSVECDQPAGSVANDQDCDDGDAAVNPAAAEVCNDGVDNDCDASTDDTTGDTWYFDRDLDGYGDAGVTTTSCDQPPGYVTLGTDCDDASDAVNPAAAEICDAEDNDCDGDIDVDAVDATTWYADADGDGWGDASTTAAACDRPAGYVETDEDCDDADAGVYPAAMEFCNGTDDDCDGTADNDAVDASTWYADTDSDGYGDPAVSAVECSAPAGYVADGTDCDDADGSVSPGMAEACNGKDDDCDGTVPSDETDDDGDGDNECSGGDCDDADDTVYLGADEYCGGVDHDCDGVVDEATSEDATRYWQDSDSDGWGGTTFSDSCSEPSGYVTANGDCDDGDASLNLDDADSDGYDTCDGDCDDTDDELIPADRDGDGQSTCDGDCDDEERTMYLGGTETCDDRDNDCDGTVDDGVTNTYYPDDDRDGYGDPAGTTVEECSRPTGYSTAASATDCDDSSSSAYPGATETCNLVDDDCDGSTDEDFDADADGAYDDAACSYGDDCDDADATVYTGATEACDGLDNNCDGSVDEDFDADADGFADASTCVYGDDCDDADPDAYPRDHELGIGEDANCLDGADNDCDGDADAADWDCQNDDGDEFDSDDDGTDDTPIYNGIDALYSLDVAGDGTDDTVCVVAEYVVGEGYELDDGVRQGTPSATWGGFTAVYAPNTDTLDAVDAGAWCFDFGSSGLTATRYRYRYVASSTIGASSCSGWETADLSDFCDVYRDEWCTEYGTGTAPCGYNWVVGVKLNSDGSISED